MWMLFLFCLTMFVCGVGLTGFVCGVGGVGLLCRFRRAHRAQSQLVICDDGEDHVFEM